MKIDFKHFKQFVDITHEKSAEIDARKNFADYLYKSVNGVAALELAMRIYKSDGEMDLSEEDMAILRPFIERNCAPIFIDSFNSNLK